MYLELIGKKQIVKKPPEKNNLLRIGKVIFFSFFLWVVWEEKINKNGVEEIITHSKEVQISSFIERKNFILLEEYNKLGVSIVAKLPAGSVEYLSDTLAYLYCQELDKNPPKLEQYKINFIKKYAKIAIKENLLYDVPASIKLAQAAIETGFGKKAVGNNFFGIKAKKSDETVEFRTSETYTESQFKFYKKQFKITVKRKFEYNGQTMYDCYIVDRFKRYKDAEESFEDHSRFLLTNKRYHKMFVNGRGDIENWKVLIRECGYATSLNYEQAISTINKHFKLYQLDI